MKYTLLGSKTSPFVRRIRIIMEDTPHDFKVLDIFNPEDAEILHKISPINQIPVLLHGDRKIFDSRQIFNYLNQGHGFLEMNWDKENTLSAIDAAISSAVAILMMRRSGMDLSNDFMYVKRQRERIELILDHLKPMDFLNDWNFLSISLYCFLDWASFREIISLDDRPEFQSFLESHAEKTIIKSTAIPRG